MHKVYSTLLQHAQSLLDFTPRHQTMRPPTLSPPSPRSPNRLSSDVSSPHFWSSSCNSSCKNFSSSSCCCGGCFASSSSCYYGDCYACCPCSPSCLFSCARGGTQLLHQMHQMHQMNQMHQLIPRACQPGH